MGRLSSVGLASVLLLQIAASAIAAEVMSPTGQAPGSFSENVRALVRVAAQKLGGGDETIVSTLGQPPSVSSEDIPNKHQPSQIDQIKTLRYEGLVIRLYNVVAFKKEMLLSVRMTRNLPETFPLLIGASDKTIRDKYGDPERVEGTIHRYVLRDDESGQDMVNIEFADSAVSAVEWSYYVD